MMSRKSARNQTTRLALSALLTALMLVLGFIESMLPVGAIPGIKLGLSNGVLIFAIYMLGVPNAFLLMFLKVLLSGILFGGVSAMMYALAGGLLSMLVMSLLTRMEGLHPVVVSMAGGLAHNVGQVALAMIVLRTPQLMYYMAVLMAVGLAAGAITGVSANLVMKHLKHIKL